MQMYTLIHEHKYGQTVYRFRTEEVFPVTLMDGQITRLADILSIDFDEDDDTLSIEADGEEIVILSINQMEYVLHGAGPDWNVD